MKITLSNKWKKQPTKCTSSRCKKPLCEKFHKSRLPKDFPKSKHTDQILLISIIPKIILEILSRNLTQIRLTLMK
jgi:hypothetical protein